MITEKPIVISNRFCIPKSQGVTNLVSFCDNCPGQNRNRPVASALTHIVQNTPIDLFIKLNEGEQIKN